MAVGFSGTGQINQLGYYETFVRPRRPDIVVLVFVNNDFANNSSLLEAIRVGWHPQHTPRVFARENAEGRIELQPPDPDWSSYRLPVPADTQPWLHAKLHRASRLYRWVYAKLTLLYPGLAARMGAPISNADQAATRLQALVADPGFARLLAGWDPATNGDIDTMFGNEGPLPLAFEQALRFTRFAFDTYNRETAEDGSHLVVLAGEEVGGRIEARLKTMLAERSIPFLSLKDFIRAKGGALEAAHWRHDAHWSPQGHAWAAELLADHIAAGHFCPGT
jgi:hypothetical protein